MKHLAALCCLIFFPVYLVSAQELLKVEHSCNYFTEVKETAYYQFTPSEEFTKIVNEIIEKSGVKSSESYVIKESNVSNALATYIDGQRYILYNPVFLDEIKTTSRTKWASYSILAHEIGHHVNNHPFGADTERQRKIFELEADVFSGEALRALGAPLQEALSGIRQLPDSTSKHSNYPSKRSREAAIANGWKSRDDMEADTSFRSKINQMLQRLNSNMVLVKGGVYLANPKGKSSSRVAIPDFYIGKYEVTQHEWETIMGRNPSFFKGCPNCPVENVSWNDIQLFLRKLNQKTGLNYRLLSEAEWEFAFTGGDTSLLNSAKFDSTLYKYAYFNENTKGKPQPVGMLTPNMLGLYDMLGNVSEWCQDWYSPDFLEGTGTANSKTEEKNGNFKVIRGGSWLDSKAVVLTGFRARHLPNICMPKYGFRIGRQ